MFLGVLVREEGFTNRLLYQLSYLGILVNNAGPKTSRISLIATPPGQLAATGANSHQRFYFSSSTSFFARTALRAWLIQRSLRLFAGQSALALRRCNQVIGQANRSVGKGRNHRANQRRNNK